MYQVRKIRFNETAVDQSVDHAPKPIEIIVEQQYGLFSVNDIVYHFTLDLYFCN